MPPKLRLSPWTSEIVKLAESGIEDSVVLTFIENAGVFSLGADQIIYLSDLGVSSQIVNTMLQHDRELISGQRQFTIVSEPASEALTWVVSSDAASADAASAADKGLANTPVPAPPGDAQRAENSHGGISSEYGRPVPGSQTAVLQSVAPSQPEPTRPPVSHPPRPLPEKKRPLYPVREPYPVELLPPIIFINAPERTPNAVILAGFAAP
ncbi:MAG: hypothetical protein EXS35_15520 [Pedosphaera sp.]|nr:hypothetical protein [Pedosphaera sp.]